MIVHVISEKFDLSGLILKDYGGYDFQLLIDGKYVDSVTFHVVAP